MKGEHEHWMEGEARGRVASGGELRAWTGWGFVFFAGIAVGYGLWGLYGSGSSLVRLDVTRAIEDRGSASPASRLGPIRLDPAMNPLRAVLHATYAPVGSSRMDYEVTFEDAAGKRLFRERGFFGSRDDEASVVRATASLATFEVPSGGDYFVRALGPGSSMDDLREAKLEIRSNVIRVDSRIPWGFGLAAFGCLVVNLLVGPLRRPRDPRVLAP